MTNEIKNLNWKFDLGSFWIIDTTDEITAPSAYLAALTAAASALNAMEFLPHLVTTNPLTHIYIQEDKRNPFADRMGFEEVTFSDDYATVADLLFRAEHVENECTNEHYLKIDILHNEDKTSFVIFLKHLWYFEGKHVNSKNESILSNGHAPAVADTHPWLFALVHNAVKKVLE